MEPGASSGRLAAWLGRRRLRPLLVLEQAVEKGSPNTVDAVPAHRQGLANARAVFAALT